MHKIIFMILIALAIAGGIAWYSEILAPAASAPVTPIGNLNPGSAVHNLPVNTSTAGFARLGPNAIYIAEQRPGRELVINVVNIAAPGYVVIHESNDENPGAVIGNSSLIESAESRNIKVALRRAAKDGEELIAMLHTEKGVAGFDPATDLPVLDAGGNPTHAIFQVSASAPDPESSVFMF